MRVNKVISSVFATQSATESAVLLQKIRERRGDIQIPITTTITVQKEISVKVAFRNSRVDFLFSSESPFERYCLNVGIKATETLFSAKRRRKRFGIMKAVAKASAYMEVPRNLAFVISRISPIIREAKVKRDSEIPDFISLLFFSDIKSVYLTLYF